MLKFRIDGQRRYLLITAGVLLFVGVIYWLFPFFQEIQAAGTEIALKERQLAKYRQMVQKKDALQARLISLVRTVGQAESGLLTGETAALAAVDIQNILNEAAGRSGVEIKTVRVLKTGKMVEDQENYLSVPVQFTISSTIGQLKEMLYRIETSPKYLAIKKIRISVSKTRGSGQLRSDLTVAGAMKQIGNASL